MASSKVRAKTITVGSPQFDRSFRSAKCQTAIRFIASECRVGQHTLKQGMVSMKNLSQEIPGLRRSHEMENLPCSGGYRFRGWIQSLIITPIQFEKLVLIKDAIKNSLIMTNQFSLVF